ncbi:MAG: hypothetical protein P8I03_05260 [Thalassotalea sp.]|nr:hypothetical protein [Thalassotalea sp.]
MKLLASIAVVILLACGGALWFLAGGSLNEFIKLQIETVGKQITEQKVAVNTVDIQLTNGAGSILGLSVENPKEYTYPHAFTLGEITLDINVESLTKEPIIIDAIVIKNPKAFVQFTSSGDSNIKDLLDIIKKNIPDANETTAEQEPAGSKPEPKISVSKIILAGTALTVDLSALGNKEHSAVLQDIVLTNIGGKDGLPASELGGVIVKEALSAIWTETKNTQKKQLKKQATDKLKDKAKKKLSELFNKS